MSGSYSCYISDLSSQWEGAIFDPRCSEIWGAIDPKLRLRSKKHVQGPPHMPNMVKIGLRAWAGPIPSLSRHWFSLCLFVFVLHIFH